MKGGPVAGGSLADGVLQDRISGEVGWQQITYTYDPSGRRIAKDVDGQVTRYVYDGDQCIAEYDANDVQLRKYVYGPGIDEPHSASLRAGSFCMIEAAGGYAGTYYYHFDALGSVVALSDAAGDTVQVYEYDVYGQPAASDPNHPNRFLFTGREFDTETGLYYYRARYYNPTIGRFLQTDPMGYGDGMNMYAYCWNGPVNAVDALGRAMLTQATGRLAISQGPETTSYLHGATTAANWTQIKDTGTELLGQAAEEKGFLYDVAKEVVIHTIQELMSGVAAGIISAAKGAASAATTVGRGWRAFIEVKDYNDINANEKVDPDDWEPRAYTEKDLWGKPYWVELKGVYPIGTPQNPTGGAGSHWGDVSGYDSAEAALGACHTAMALLAQPVLVSKAFGGYWDSGHASPLEPVNWCISLQLSAADVTDAFIGNLEIVSGGTQ